MAKPFADLAGSGLHVHVSLLDREGRNAFSGDVVDPRIGRAISPLMRHAIAGLVDTMAEGMAIFAPHRIPGGDARDLRIEHRVAGADASPYLVAAAVLAGMLHGIERELEPPEPVTGDGYAQEGAPIPLFWPDALRAFEAGEVLPSAFGAKWAEAFLAARRQELETHHFTIPPLDYAWYLRTV